MIMTKSVLAVLTISLVSILFIHAQSNMTFTSENFDKKILNYSPIQKPQVSDKDYRKGMMILEEIRTATDHNPENLNEADYWNICVAFMALQEPKKHLEIAFLKGTQNPETFCSYIEAFDDLTFDKALPELFQTFYAKCGEIKPSEEQTISSYSGPNANLKKLIAQIKKDDRKYRKDKIVDWEKQHLLDKKNQHLVDSLYQEYSQYIGKSLVGEELQSVMWAVIQHSYPEMMKKYIPVIHKAVQSGESQKTMLKMLLDRYYAITEGYQFFGSQQGFNARLANTEEKKRILQEYDLY